MSNGQLTRKIREVRELEAEGKVHVEEMYRRPGHQARRKILLDLMSEYVAGKEFVEIGCAEGIYCNDASLFRARDVVGVDISSRKISRAKELYPHLEFSVGDAGEFACACGRQFDFVLLTEVLQHIVDYKRAIADALSILRANGLLLISIPNLSKGDGHEFAKIDDAMTVDQLLKEIGGAGHGKQNALWKFNSAKFADELVNDFPLELVVERAVDTPDGQIRNLWTVLLFRKK